ncbi:TIGR03435 family protein [Telmatobacter sp. DSM 110680]|uniref:TIGR03435 family protein n=1 Tax=Telmatobacter sp. DSM 110680 TaxID=3036704 RepID=A0AAU7DG13_9BACT
MSIRTLLLVPTALVMLSAAPAIPPQAASVPYAPTLTFDVTSVKECLPGPHGNGLQSPLHSSQLTATGVWAAQLVGLAYGLDYRTQVLGGPEWVQATRSNDIRFDVQARSDSITNDRLARLSDDRAKLEKEHMIRALLVDRFGLKAHLETREAPAFTLTIAKRGPKLEKGSPVGPNTGIESDPDPKGIALIAHGATIADLSKTLQFYLRKTVIDQSGIVGTFDFKLQFHGSLSDMGTDEESMWPPVETAIQEQLGLQLKNTKAPVSVVVIDHIQMPSPN